MTFGHLYFSIMCTAYIFLAIQFEGRDLITFYGEAYQVYRSGVSMLVPCLARKKNRSEGHIQTLKLARRRSARCDSLWRKRSRDCN
jgi:hypothetical protein